MRKTKARFRVEGARVDNACGATVTVDERCGLITVRPYRRRRQYTLPLEMVARMIVGHVVRAELAEKRKTKKRATARRGERHGS